MKKVTQKTSKNISSDPLQYHTIVLENIQHTVGLLADGMMTLNEKIDRTNETVDRLEQKVDRMDTRLTSVELDVMDIKDRLKNVESTMATKEDLKDHSKRIEKLEHEILA